MKGVLRIAIHEVRRYITLIDRRFLVIVLVAGLVIGFSWPLLEGRGIRPDAGLYTIEIEEDSPYLAVVEADDKFQVLLGLKGRFYQEKADLLLVENIVGYDATRDKSLAAARELQLSTRAWLDDAMTDEGNQDAAFPVRVNLVYEARDVSPTATQTPSPSPTPEAATSAPPPPGDTGPPQIVAAFDHQDAAVTPGRVDPPFPIQSLLLTFAYLIPLNFLAQLYSGSIYGERVRKRGVLLLATPLSNAQVLLGKSLPYVGLTVLLGLVTTLVIGSNVTGLLAIFPVLGFLLAAALLMGILARSPRELTFLLVTLTVVLSTFLFLPAVFTQVHPVAFLSPITVVVHTLEGNPVPLGSFLYATLPFTLITIVLASLALALYREEELFAPKTVASKLATAIHLVAPHRWSLPIAGALAVPFAIGLELFILIFAVTLDLRAAFVLFLLGGALAEEALKGIISYAHLTRAPERAAKPWLTGLLVGTGFYLGEKIALIFTLVGFGDLPLAHEALASFGVSRAPLLVILPLGLHVGAATITAYAARRKKMLFLGLFAAVLLHATYNTLILVWQVLGGTP